MNSNSSPNSRGFARAAAGLLALTTLGSFAAAQDDRDIPWPANPTFESGEFYSAVAGDFLGDGRVSVAVRRGLGVFFAYHVHVHNAISLINVVDPADSYSALAFNANAIGTLPASGSLPDRIFVTSGGGVAPYVGQYATSTTGGYFQWTQVLDSTWQNLREVRCARIDGVNLVAGFISGTTNLKVASEDGGTWTVLNPPNVTAPLLDVAFTDWDGDGSGDLLILRTDGLFAYNNQGALLSGSFAITPTDGMLTAIDESSNNGYSALLCCQFGTTNWYVKALSDTTSFPVNGELLAVGPGGIAPMRGMDLNTDGDTDALIMRTDIPRGYRLNFDYVAQTVAKTNMSIEGTPHAVPEHCPPVIADFGRGEHDALFCFDTREEMHLRRHLDYDSGDVLPLSATALALSDFATDPEFPPDMPYVDSTSVTLYVTPDYRGNDGSTNLYNVFVTVWEVPSQETEGEPVAVAEGVMGLAAGNLLTLALPNSDAVDNKFFVEISRYLDGQEATLENTQIWGMAAGMVPFEEFAIHSDGPVIKISLNEANPSGGRPVNVPGGIRRTPTPFPFPERYPPKPDTDN